MLTSPRQATAGSSSKAIHQLQVVARALFCNPSPGPHSSINTTIAHRNRVTRCIDRLHNSIMAEPQIKPEPDAAASPFMDEADETPDLEFYDRMPGPDADAYSRMYLTRVPNYVWEAWSKLDDDAEIEIGTIRQWTDQTGKPVRQPASK
jgi:hypothetical protein